MNIQDKVLSAINEVKARGYERISVSELAHNTRVQRHVIIKTLKTKGHKMQKVRGELYISLREITTIEACWLPAPRQLFESD